MSNERGIDTGRLGRVLALIAFVTVVFLMLTQARFSGTTLRIGFVAIGTVAFITAMVGVLIAAGSAFDE